MIYVRALMSALGAAGLLTKLLVGVGIAAAALTAYGIWHHKVYQSGVNDTYAKIARDDAAAVGRASKMRDQFEACTGRNGSWDQTTGRCR